MTRVGPAIDEIVPIFSKLGCNAGGCHGKAEGQNGFQGGVQLARRLHERGLFGNATGN